MSDELFDKRYRPTAPSDLHDPPRFGQPLETTKDAFVLGLRQFFNEQQVVGRLRELPTIEKYQAGFEAGNDPFLTTVEIVQEFPDVLEKLPHISVTAASARNRRVTVGVPLIDQVQYPPRVEASATGPFDLSTATGVVPREYVLRYRTQPERRGVWVESVVALRQSRFADWSQATVQDVVRVINEQALYAHAFVTPEGTVAMECGGRAGGDVRPNVIEILGTSTPGILNLLGFSSGQTDNVFNTARPPANRYHLASEVIVNVDVLSVDINTRREITDLIYGWAIFWLERDFFELQGRTWTDEDVNSPQEWWHITFHQEVSVGQFQVVDRPQSGKDKTHVQRVTIPVTLYQYIDRPVRTSTGANFVLSTALLTEDPSLPKPS